MFGTPAPSQVTQFFEGPTTLIPPFNKGGGGGSNYVLTFTQGPTVNLKSHSFNIAATFFI